jgi:DoxX-like family
VPWPIVTETMDRIGYGSSETLARSLGFITIVCTILYAIPPTSILGAILLTGYLGGAMASHVPDRQSAVQSHAVRVLSRADVVGRALVARSEPARINTLPALTCVTDNSQTRSLSCSKSLPSSPS